MSIASEISRISQNVADSLTAVAAKGVTVPTGSNSDDLPELIRAIPTGSGSAITVTDETDEHGGIIRHINAVSLAGITVTPAHLEQGYTAVNALGETIEGTLDPSGGGGGGNYQAKTNINPTTSSQTIRPDNGYDALSSVQINAMPSMTLPTGAASSATTGYSSKATISRSSGDQYINIPTGYNAAGAYYKINGTPNMTLPTSATSSATSGYTNKATISRSTSDQYINIPTGYNTAGAYYKIDAIQNGTEGTPTATKGTVSNHSITVTPSVTNTEGYISGSTKTGTAVTVSASELVSGAKSITSNGTGIDVTNYATVNVNVSGGGSSPVIDSLEITPSETAQTYNSSDVDGYKPVTVSAISSTYVGSEIERRSGSDVVNVSTNPWTYSTNSLYAYITHDITAPNGYYASDVTKGFTIQVAQTGVPTQAAATITPSESEQTAVAKWKWTTGEVKVAAIPSDYVGSGITTRSSSDLTASGATVTVPAGYYSSQATKSVTTATLPTSTTTTKPSGTTKLTIDRSTSTRYLSIPAGYQDGGFYTISAVANGTVTAPSSISGTTATVSTGTNTLTLTKTVSVTPSVTTAGYVSAGTAGNSNVSLTASVTTKAAATITPGTTNQTIAAGTYLTGTQTISGDADLVGSNILSTANIFGVQGTVVVQHIYSGSSAPSSSTGANGDVYIRTS